MGFMSDSLNNGRLLCKFNMFDDFSRDSLAIDVDLSSPAQKVFAANY